MPHPYSDLFRRRFAWSGSNERPEFNPDNNILQTQRLWYLHALKFKSAACLWFNLHTITAHSCLSASGAAQSVQAMSAKLRKVREGRRTSSGRRKIWRKKHPNGALGAHKGSSRWGGGGADRGASVQMGTGKCAAGYFSPSVRASSKLQPPLILRERLQLIYSVFNPGTPSQDLPPQVWWWVPAVAFVSLDFSLLISGVTTRSLPGSAADGGCGWPSPTGLPSSPLLDRPTDADGERGGGGVSRGYALIPVCLALWSSRIYLRTYCLPITQRDRTPLRFGHQIWLYLIHICIFWSNQHFLQKYNTI